MECQRLSLSPHDRFIKVVRTIDPEDILQSIMNGSIILDGRIIFYDMFAVIDSLDLGEIVHPVSQIENCTREEAIQRIHSYMKSLPLPYDRFVFRRDEHLRFRTFDVPPKNLGEEL